MGRWAYTIVLSAASVFLTAGCAGPITQVGTVSQADIQAEQQQQLRLAAEVALVNQRRLERLAAQLLDAAAPLCGRSA